MTTTPHKAIGTLAYFVLMELPNEVMQDEYTQSHVYPTALDVRSWLQEIGEWDDYQGGSDDHVRRRPSHGVGIDNPVFPGRYIRHTLGPCFLCDQSPSSLGGGTAGSWSIWTILWSIWTTNIASNCLMTTSA
jgi:hypothetical protein